MKRIAILPILALAAVLLAQPPTTSWPTYHGDYTGRRFSPLTRINDKNISGLAMIGRPGSGRGLLPHQDGREYQQREDCDSSHFNVTR
jgi:glucose dehydrogenase